MTRLIWNKAGERFYEVGVDRGVLFNKGSGTQWNGLINVTEKVAGGEPKPYYIDGVKYRNEAEVEEFEASIEAFTYPDAFAELDGVSTAGDGLSFGLQPRKEFGLTYRTMIGNDLNPEFGYKVHLIYNALATPTERSNSTLSTSMDPNTFSWDLTARPIWIPGRKPTAHLIIDSTKVDRDLLNYVEGYLYGSSGIAPRLPSPYDLVMLFGSWEALGLSQPLNFLGELVPANAWITNLYPNPSFETANGGYNRRVNYVTNPGMIPGGVATVDIRTNLAINPSSEVNSSTWSVWSGTSGTAGLSRLTDGGFVGTSYHRASWTVAQSAGGADIQGGLKVGQSLAPTAKSFSMYVRSNKQQRVIPIVEVFDNVTPPNGVKTQIRGTAVVLEPGVWTRLTQPNLTLPANTLRVEYNVYAIVGTGFSAWQIGDTLDADAVLIEDSMFVDEYFDGSYGAAGDYTYVWSGTAHASSSIQRALSLTAPYSKDSGTANGPIFASTQQAKFGTTSLKCIAATASGDVGFAYSVPPSNLTVGVVYTVSWWVYSVSARTASFDCTRSAEGNNRGLTNIPAGVWTEVRGTFTMNAGTNIAVPFWLHHKAGPLAAGEAIYVDGFMIYDGAIPLPYFDGSTPDTGTFDYAWAGAVNGSNSLEIVARAANTNYTAGQTLAYLAADETYGKVWQHLIQNVNAYGVNADMPGLTSGQEYTILIRARASRDMQVKPRIYSVQSSGGNYALPAGVWTDIRAVITPGAYNTFTGLIGPGLIGHQPGDTIDIAQMLIVQGNYTGPFFDGDTDSIIYQSQETIGSWVGATHASASKFAYSTALPIDAKPGDGYAIDNTEYLTVLDNGLWRMFVLEEGLAPPVIVMP